MTGALLPLNRRRSTDQAPLNWSGILATQAVSQFGDAGKAGQLAATQSWRLGSAVISVGQAGPVRAVRGPEHIETDRRDDYALVMSVRGEWSAVFGIRKYRVLPKQVVVLDLACGWTIDWPASKQIVIVLPRSIVRALCPRAPRLHGRVLRTASGGMLSDQLMSLAEKMSTLQAGDAGAVELALLNLVASAISGIPQDILTARTASVEAGDTAARVRRHVEENLTDLDLSARSLCARLGLSKTALERALGPSGQVGDYIRSRRLAAAREMIAESVVPLAVADIAGMFCFRTEDEFKKAFLRYFGYEPLDARNSSLGRCRKVA